MNANKATEKTTVGEAELQASGNVWMSPEFVNSMQSIWAKDPEPKGKSNGGMRKDGSLESASGRSSDESPTPPSGYLTNEHMKKGRILMNQVFNGLETLETDRVYYESVLKIAPLTPFRQLLRCSDFDGYSVAQMLSETQRQFGIHVCFLNAIHAALQKAKEKPPANKSQAMWKKMVDDAEKAKIALTGKPSTPERKSKAEQAKADAEKGVQKLLGKVIEEWEKILRSIQALGETNGSKQFKNLELMPFHMENLVKVLEEARLGIWLMFSQVQIELGKSPIQSTLPKKNVCIPLSKRNRK